MLTPSYLDAMPDPVVELYEEYAQAVINDIARRIMNVDLSSAAWQVKRLSESGLLYNDILERLSTLTGKSEATLRALFKEAGVKAMAFDDAVYIKAGLKPLPLNLSPAMTDVLLAGLQKTAGLMRNLTLTTALTGQNAFIDALDLAYMEVSTGSMSYTQAIRAAVKKVAADGLSVINYAGRHDQLDVATRRAVLTGISQTTGIMQMDRAREMGCTLMQTTAHAGSRPTHEVWQGRVFTIAGDVGYEDYVTATGYGMVDGIYGINCRHSAMPFFKGLSENAYSEAYVDEMNSKVVTYNGKEMSQYDASQIQRSIEREIRKVKREASALEAAGLDNSEELAKVKRLQAQMRAFTRESGLMRQPEREII